MSLSPLDHFIVVGELQPCNAVVREPDLDAMPLPHHRIDHNASVSVFFCRDVAGGY
jgi:hypothetical protein